MLTAGESDARGLMPVTLLAERIIEVATEHANALGIGYAVLIEKNVGWVLSRLSMEVMRYPSINENYTVKTWIETYNRRFSERNFEMTATDTGEVLAYIRSVWVPMDFASRTVADLTAFTAEIEPAPEITCPIAKAPRIAPLGDAVESFYTFRYCDIDFNRHVNTVRYIELILNQWPLEQYDKHCVARFDILFHHECCFGQEVAVRIASLSADTDACELVLPDASRAVAASIRWR